jgi:enoyl-CoA hydratase
MLYVRSLQLFMCFDSFSTFTQLGGGCELALMCDIILASPTAKFGQPEINLGVIPGGGGSQRLIHAIGKSRTMELVLTGRNFTAKEASDWGMVSRVVGEGEGEVVKEAVSMAAQIASKSQLAVQAGKEVVNAGMWTFHLRCCAIGA